MDIDSHRLMITSTQLFRLFIKFFSRVNVTLEAAMSVGRSVGWSVAHIFSCGHATLSEALSVRPLVGRSIRNHQFEK